MDVSHKEIVIDGFLEVKRGKKWIDICRIPNESNRYFFHLISKPSKYTTTTSHIVPIASSKYKEIPKDVSLAVKNEILGKDEEIFDQYWLSLKEIKEYKYWDKKFYDWKKFVYFTPRELISLRWGALFKSMEYLASKFVKLPDDIFEDYTTESMKKASYEKVRIIFWFKKRLPTTKVKIATFPPLKTWEEACRPLHSIFVK